MRRFFLFLLLASPFCSTASKELVFTYTEEEISVESDVIKLAGTRLIPGGNNISNWPVVLIIAGSGPTDRDGNQGTMKTNAYKFLAEELAKKGIASVRYDKRAVGKSEVKNLNEADLRFDHYVADAVTMVKWMKEDKRFNRIVILGHSEGSLIGMIAAQQCNPDMFISLSGAGRPAADLLRIQFKNQSEELLKESDPILDSLEKGFLVKNVSPFMQMLFFRPTVMPYLISWFKYDPAKEIAKLKIPTMILNGTTDLQVNVEEAKLLGKGKPDAKFLLIKKMNHVLKEAPADRNKNLNTYSNSALPVVPKLVQSIADFIYANTKAG